MTMDTRPIGIFDSGLGGLTAVKAIKARMPSENIVYFGDTGRVPYGTRSRETILSYTRQDIRFLLSKGVKMVIAACNTASTVITDTLIREIPVPLIEVLSPAVSAAVSKTKTGSIGVICTSATRRSGAYERGILKRNPNYSVSVTACPLFVPLVENGYTDRDNPVTRLVAQEYLSSFQETDADTLILGCTHYPILKELIGDMIGDRVTMIDSGREAAETAFHILEERGLANRGGAPGTVRYYVSDIPDDFTVSAKNILKEEILPMPERISIESF